jgi:hypothetical protein
LTAVLAFVDGLGHDMQQDLPYLSTLRRARLRTELGYSVTCHASMYTGVAPREHGFWFLWQRAPERSPFRWLRTARLDRLPDAPLLKVGLHRLTRARHRNTSFFGLPFPAHTPLALWPQLAPTETKLWPEPGYSAAHPTWFDRLRGRARVRVTGIAPREAAEACARIEALDADPTLDLDYLFFGDVDPLCHRLGKDHAATRERIARVDRALDAHVRKYEARGQRVEVLAWSDHGHHAVQRRVPIFPLLRAAGLDLHALPHVVDANYARFWPRTPAEEQRVRRALAGIDKGWVLDAETLAAYQVDFPDGRYGTLIFYLDEGAIFDKGPIRVLGRTFQNRDVSMHGYLPEREASWGFVASTRPLPRAPHIRDIAGRVLDLAAPRAPLEVPA